MNSLETTAPSPETEAAPDVGARPTTRSPGRSDRNRWSRGRRRDDTVPSEHDVGTRVVDPVPIAGNDPLLVYLTAVRRPVDVDDLGLASPAADAMRAAGVRMLVPLVASGELIGVIQLGERLSEQGYSADDRHLLEMLAGQAAPALRVGQLVQEQQTQVRVRERYEQELKVAQLIQQRFLPHDLPEPPGWRIHPHYLAAREVGGDFYDVLDLPDGKLGLVIGDVTDKGVPAALVMASTRSVLRAAAQRLVDPAAVLARVNDELVRDIPAKMFVTCLYGVLDPATGSFRFANAGHDLPFLYDGELTELWATGMPLGMLPGTTYDEVTVDLAPGSRLLLYSDGLAEAHAPDGEMFGFPRVGEVLRDLNDSDTPIQEVLDALHAFTGDAWQQEDDVTLLLVQRAPEPHLLAAASEVLTGFSVPSVPGGERDAIANVMGAIAQLPLANDRRDALEMAVGEAVMNAMEHGNAYASDKPVHVEVTVTGDRLHVAVTDLGGGTGYLEAAEEPDIQAKLRGEQSPRGWGLFLVRSLVDEVHETGDDEQHTLTLEMRLGGSDEA